MVRTAASTKTERATTRNNSLKGRNIVILCDGTGNELGGALSQHVRDIRISNVLKLFRIAQKGQRQLVYYSQGIGTIGRPNWLMRFRQKTAGVIGLVTGYGLDDNVLGAYRFLVENWEEGDRIYLFGFSRGAWTVRVLAGLLHLVGLLRPSQLNLCDNALATYKRAATDNALPIAWHFARVMGTRFPSIHFMGCWDTVASVIVPRSDRVWVPSLETLPFTKANPSVKVFRHALALDERRRMFRVAEWEQPQDHVPNRFEPDDVVGQDIEQRWFPGVHSDIGGGYAENESALSKIPLIWMIEAAVKSGLIITQSNLHQLAYGKPKPNAPQTGPNAQHEYVEPSALGPIHKSLGFGWMPLEVMPKRTKYIETRSAKFFGFYIPLAEARRLRREHVIDAAVYCRQSRLKTYRPKAEIPPASPGTSICAYD